MALFKLLDGGLPPSENRARIPRAAVHVPDRVRRWPRTDGPLNGCGDDWPLTLCTGGYERGHAGLTIAGRQPLTCVCLAGKARVRADVAGADIAVTPDQLERPAAAIWGRLAPASRKEDEE